LPDVIVKEHICISRCQGGIFENENSMTDQTKTREEFVKELQEVHRELAAFKKTYQKDIIDSKQTLEALQESKVKYQTIFESTGTAMLIVEEDTTIFMANNECYSITGYTPDDLIGQRWVKYVAPESVQEMLKNHQLRRQNPDLVPQKYQVKLVNKKGEVRSAIIDIGIIPNTKQSVVSILDITDSKKAEEALSESEAVHRNLVERMPDGVYKSTHDGKFLDVNPAMVKMLGYESKEDLKSIDIKTQLYFEPADRESAVLQEKLEEMGVYPLKKKDGSAIWVEDHGWYNADENGNILFHEGIMRDITDRRKTEKLMSMLAHATRSISECISITDMYDTIIYINRAFLKTYKYEEHELLGNSITMVRSPNNPPVVVQDILPATLRGGWQGELLNTRKDGSEFPIYISSSVIRDENGEPIALVGIATDITERKRSEDELKLKNEQLNSAIAEKDKFFSIISHDLRSPFNSLLGFTELLERELPTMSSDQIQQIAVTMRKSATNVYNLLENLLEWSRLQRGLIPFNPEPMLLMPKVLAETMQFMESANKKEITLNYDMPEDLKVYADEYMLGCILRNLTSNAVKFTPKGGKITISAKSLDRTVECSVSDTGIGMNQKMKENLFNIDVNTSRKGTEREASTGLGLILCKEFVEKHGGKLWVESEEGKGSTFYFTLPSKKDKMPQQDMADMN